MKSRHSLVVLLGLSLAACGGSEPSVDAGPPDLTVVDLGRDSGTEPDATAPDLGADAGGAIVLSNLAASCTAPTDSVFALLPEEAGHYAAARLMPSAYPFSVTSIDYRVGHLAGQLPQCDGGLAHRVNVFVIDGDVPGPAPSTDGTLVQSFDVPAATVVDFRSIHLDLAPAVVLADGQSIVIAVQQAVDDPSAPTKVCCIATCAGDPTAVPAVDYWSSAPAEPYDWQDLVVAYGFNLNLWVTATGVAAP